MKKKRIYGLIALMSVALLGLVAFQVYWIRETVEANRQRFQQSVYEALNTVVHQLEQREALLFAYQSFGPDLVQLDTTQFYPSRTVRQRQRQSVTFDERGRAVRQRLEFSMSVGRAPGSSPVIVVRPDLPPNASEQMQQEQLRKLKQKASMFEQALHQLMNGDRPLTARLNPKQLRTLLSEALADRGITLPYQYAVVDAQRDSVLMASTANFFQKYDTDAEVTLFPNDFMPSSTFLTLEFPQQSWYLLKQIWLTLLSSLLFTGIVVFCFGYAITTILRQKKLSDMKTDFINNMTHELKTPISTVALAVEARQDEQIARDPSYLQRYLGIIREENARLGSQVERVLQIATLDKQDFQLKREPVDLHELIRQVAERLRPAIEKRNGTLTLELNAANSMIQADAEHLANVVTNLIDNANKYSSDQPTVTVRTQSKDQGIAIEVVDRGMGMTKETAANVFDKFYRAPTGNRHDVKGFGLGLAYVKSMVEAHGGQVSVRSKLGQGSTFWVHIPVA
ncbi:MAG: HAMP domain-containing sensor histidine kinase [Tunicatimonas sp.]